MFPAPPKTRSSISRHLRKNSLWKTRTTVEDEYKFVAPVNDQNLIGNCRLYEVYPPAEPDDARLWGGLLNSTIAVLSSLQFGRPVGNEGNWSTMVVDLCMMLVPDPRKAKEAHKKRVIAAFEGMKRRKALPFLSERRLKQMRYKAQGREEELAALSDKCELDMPDRRELDDAVLRLLGVGSPREREEWLDKLYGYLREFFERTRQKEEKAIENKNRSKRRGVTSPAEIAAQIVQEMSERDPQWLKSYPEDFLAPDCECKIYDLPATGQAEKYTDLYVPHGVRFAGGRKTKSAVEAKSEAHAGLLVLLANAGLRGLVRIPFEDNEAVKVHKTYARFVAERGAQLKQFIAERTADEDLGEKILREALNLLQRD